MNYVIENNFDWKSLLNNDSEITEDNNICLISGLPLQDAYIKLPCSHTFNYISLFKELIKQKNYSSHLEVNKLKINQMKCPYCRTIFNNILPFYKSKDTYKVNGVNYPEKYALNIGSCQYKFKSGTKKNCLCGKIGFNTESGIFCNKHIQKTPDIQIDSEENYKKLTIPQLKVILRKNNCKVGGNKMELLERIIQEKNKILDLWKN